ncbi:hypothetical protein ACRYCC_27105 [Actinomadura scrupuli]|uniref:hypothetical protein n=1 Tax=Actinomadura scrupuli TaxID=559629 RepID=UPI003D9567CB
MSGDTGFTCSCCGRHHSELPLSFAAPAPDYYWTPALADTPDSHLTAQVWDNGAVVLGPLHLGENQPFPITGTPISQALRRLGVTKGNHHDEFDAVGLGRYRRTEAWLKPTK